MAGSIARPLRHRQPEHGVRQSQQLCPLSPWSLISDQLSSSCDSGCEAHNRKPSGRPGVAALAVVLLHSALAGRDFGGPFLGFDIFKHGYLGVDFFFVLSGFIIYHSTVGRGRTPTEYATARFRRVYLPYWPVGIAVALIYVTFPSVRHGTGEWSWLATLTLAPTDVHPALSVAWTLQHEVTFYVIFGLLYFARLLPLGLAVWALGIISYGRHLPFNIVNLEFLFGIAAVVLYREERASRLLLLLVPVFVGIWIFLGADADHRVWMGAAFACIVAPLAQIERKGLRVPPSLVALGAASYSLYLVHVPLVSMTARVVGGSWALFAASVVVSIIAGFAYHFVIEERAITKRSNPEVFAGSGAVTSVAGVRLLNRQKAKTGTATSSGHGERK
jgi:exopolysaccharide production protein ExoZ